MQPCSKCGTLFVPPARRGNGGRPRTRCDDCRGSIDKIDGKLWRSIRRQVLADEPVCARPGCRRAATEVDHIIPLSRGGDPYDRDNLQPMCKFHNISKGNKLAAVPTYRRRDLDAYERCDGHRAGPDACHAAGHEPPPAHWML